MIQQKKNIDPNEIVKFDSIALRWWDNNSECKFLHLMNSLRLDYILNRTNGLFEKTVLDVGCGGGLLTESIAMEGAKVVGLDISSKLLSIAKLHALEKGLNFESIKYIQQTIEEHAKSHANNYDVITCMEVLEHVPDPMSVILSCSMLVKPGGEVFFSTINRNLKSWLLTIIFSEYLLHIIPRGTHNINKFIQPSELLSWIDKTSLCAQDLIGMKYDLIKRYFKFSKNIDVNYILYTKNIK